MPERRRWRVNLSARARPGSAVSKGDCDHRREKAPTAALSLKGEFTGYSVCPPPRAEAGSIPQPSQWRFFPKAEGGHPDRSERSSDRHLLFFGTGWPGVNTTHSAVRITHQPTGLVVSCQDERSQIKNRAKAMRILRSRLLETEQQKQTTRSQKRGAPRWEQGDRSEKIRTYNFSQNRVTDHRVGLSLHRLESVLEGEVDEIIEALTAWDHVERLQKSLS